MSRLVVIAIAALLVLGFSDAAFAGKVKLTDSGNGTSNGGEFIAEVTEAFYGHSVGDKFGTFCTEKNEFIKYNYEYTVVVATYAWNGGRNTDLGDPLDAMTAFLYTNYRAGTLKDKNGNAYTNTDDAEVDDLQEAVWYIEQEIGFWDGDTSEDSDGKDFDDSYGGNRYLKVAWEAVHGTASTDPTWTDGIGDVRIMQLWDGTKLAQDQLMLVPLPSAAYLGLGLLGGMMFVRRLRRRRSF